MENAEITLIGTCVRALADSAHRAGFATRCFDRFADWDLQRRTRAQRLPDLPWRELAPWLTERMTATWVYAGGLENEPELVATLQKTAPLWGCPAEVLPCVRDPFLLAEFLRTAGFDTPRSVPGGDHHAELSNETGLAWLVKPIASGGGIGIRRWEGGPIEPGQYLQRFLPGTAYSALYVASEQESVLLGITRQLIGVAAGAAEFHYAGNIGPLAGSTRLRRELVRLGQLLQGEGGLRGLYGVDFLLDGGLDADRPWILEVNPRYTAGMEILDLALPPSCFAWLAWAVGGASPPTTKGNVQATESPVVGKLVVYATDWTMLDERAPCYDDSTPGFADIPPPGTRIGPGHPVLTIFQREGTEFACAEKLRITAAEFSSRWFRKAAP